MAISPSRCTFPNFSLSTNIKHLSNTLSHQGFLGHNIATNLQVHSIAITDY